jgi:hypothetical protein
LIEALAAQSSSPDDEFARRALAVAEMARGRSLADLLAEADRLPNEPALREVRTIETAQGRRLSDVQRRVALAATDAERQAALAELQAAEAEFETLVTRLRREQPAYASLRYPQPVSAEQIQSLLHDDEALVEFATSERAGFGWIVRRSGVALFRIPPRPALESAVRLIEALSLAADTEGLRASGRRAGELLLGPARSRLEGVERLIVVPDGPLHRLPFAVLRLHDDRWLVEDVALAVAPSATVLSELRSRPSTPAARQVIAFAASAVNPTAERLSPAFRARGRSLEHAERKCRTRCGCLEAAGRHSERKPPSGRSGTRTSASSISPRTRWQTRRRRAGAASFSSRTIARTAGCRCTRFHTCRCPPTWSCWRHADRTPAASSAGRDCSG